MSIIINRRSVIGALAAIPAAAGPGRALDAPEAPSGLEQLLDGHRAACAANDAAYAAYARLDEEYGRPAMLVPVAFDVDTGETLPRSAQINPKGHIDMRRVGEDGVRAYITTFHRDLLGRFTADVRANEPGYLDAATEVLRGSKEKALANVDRVVAEERAARVAAGLPAAEGKVEAAEAAEDETLEEILSYRPTNMGETAVKALYLAGVIDRGGHMPDAVDTERAQRFLESLAAA
ncbi:hypothetical protein [Mesorhizobium sp. M0496]|uniref:hypothetical protein n=1 Tax=Mesorhizobium sp. M0496 TaxID=2956952 RepID=UPI0033357232